ncbi:MAG: hypothetical protein ACFFCD_11165 [Promethearchaeota archaeon]
MSDEDLRNKVKKLSKEWKETKEYQYIHEAIRTAKQIKEGQVQSFLVILHALAEAAT